MGHHTVRRVVAAIVVLSLFALAAPLRADEGEGEGAPAPTKIKVKLRKEGARGRPGRRDPIATAQRWLLESLAEQMQEMATAEGEAATNPIQLWFEGDGDVPLAGFRDALKEDGWTADELTAWMHGHLGRLLAGIHDARGRGPARGFGGPRRRGHGGGMAHRGGPRPGSGDHGWRRHHGRRGGHGMGRRGHERGHNSGLGRRRGEGRHEPASGQGRGARHGQGQGRRHGAAGGPPRGHAIILWHDGTRWQSREVQGPNLRAFTHDVPRWPSLRALPGGSGAAPPVPPVPPVPAPGAEAHQGRHPRAHAHGRRPPRGRHPGGRHRHEHSPTPDLDQALDQTLDALRRTLRRLEEAGPRGEAGSVSPGELRKMLEVLEALGGAAAPSDGAPPRDWFHGGDYERAMRHFVEKLLGPQPPVAAEERADVGDAPEAAKPAK